MTAVVLRVFNHAEEPKQVGGEHINVRVLLRWSCVIVNCISRFRIVLHIEAERGGSRWKE